MASWIGLQIENRRIKNLRRVESRQEGPLEFGVELEGMRSKGSIFFDVAALLRC